MDRSKPMIANPWTALRRFTPARIALGRAGASLPTEEVLAFGLAHGQARDAVHHALVVEKLESDLHAAAFQTMRVRSRARHRREYLLRPDLGRRLDRESADRLRNSAGTGLDLCLIVADGLSAVGVQRHAAPLLQSLRDCAPIEWSWSPIVIAEQSRVALGDEI